MELAYLFKDNDSRWKCLTVYLKGTIRSKKTQNNIKWEIEENLDQVIKFTGSSLII